MSALVNLTSLSTFISSVAVTPPIYLQHPVWNQSAYGLGSPGNFDSSLDDSPFRGFQSSDVALRGTRHHRERLPRRQFRQSREQDSDDRDKKRRSLNIPASQKPRLARLYALAGSRTNSVSIVEVQQNGSVRTTANTHSPHCK